jgi:hypothetical protein
MNHSADVPEEAESADRFSTILLPHLNTSFPANLDVHRSPGQGCNAHR